MPIYCGDAVIVAAWAPVLMSAGAPPGRVVFASLLALSSQVDSGIVAQVQQLLEVTSADVQLCVENMANRLAIVVRAEANRGPHRYVATCKFDARHGYPPTKPWSPSIPGIVCVCQLCRLLTNKHAQLMWFTYCGASADRVAVDTFVMAVAKYFEEQLGMPVDAVEGVLTPECREALTLALDVDGNGEVGSFNLPLCDFRFSSCQCNKLPMSCSYSAARGNIQLELAASSCCHPNRAATLTM